MSAVTESFWGGAVRWMAHELILALVEDETGKRPELTKASDVYGFASVCLEVRISLSSLSLALSARGYLTRCCWGRL